MGLSHLVTEGGITSPSHWRWDYLT